MERLDGFFMCLQVFCARAQKGNRTEHVLISHVLQKKMRLQYQIREYDYIIKNNEIEIENNLLLSYRLRRFGDFQRSSKKLEEVPRHEA